MRVFGLDISRVQKDMTPVWSGNYNGLFGLIREPFAGAWQRNMEIEAPKNLLAFSAVFACVSIIAQDISKLRIKLVRQTNDAIWEEVPRTEGTAFQGVIRKPNSYQTRIQFLQMWVVSKLLHGNTYVLKERSDRETVSRLHVLDPKLVVPLVTDRGDVFYELKRDDLAEQIDETRVVPASEIIHDRYLTLWHPLVGVSPIYACAASATQGIAIQNQSGLFFRNSARPSGMLTAPKKISDETAVRLKNTFETSYGGANYGRMFVGGDDLRFESITMPAQEAQLIEQQKWTVEDVARAFRVPLHKLAAGQNPTFNNIGAFNQDYYSQTLQNLIECIELLLDEGLNLPYPYGTELDIEGLLRMDPLSRADRNAKELGGGALKINEARLRENLPPIQGGDEAYMQQQYVPLSMAAKVAEATLSAKLAPPAAPAQAAPVDDSKAFRELFPSRAKSVVEDLLRDMNLEAA